MENSVLQIERLTAKDLKDVFHLQPEDWPDILPSIQYYCKSDFCFPLKAIRDNQLVGMGTAIIHGHTAWLAHIIVHKEYRNSGIGRAITQALIGLIHRTPCQSMLLIATALGEPVYKKVGFETEAEYLFFENGVLYNGEISKRIIRFEKKYKNELLKLDGSVSGEDRSKLLQEHMVNAHMFIENNAVKGFYLPTLGEGLIIADTNDAGQELMKMRFTENKKFCIPANNQHGINFLHTHGFKEYRKASRMILGKRLSWSGDKIYSRIGGNLG